MLLIGKDHIDPIQLAQATTPNYVAANYDLSGVLIAEIDKQIVTTQGVEVDITIKNPLNLWQQLDIEIPPGVIMSGQGPVDNGFWGANLIPPESELHYHAIFTQTNLTLRFSLSNELGLSTGLNLAYILLELVPGVKDTSTSVWLLALNDIKALIDIVELTMAKQDVVDIIHGDVSLVKVISLSDNVWGAFSRVQETTKISLFTNIIIKLGLANAQSLATNLVKKISSYFTVFNLCKTIASEIILVLFTWETGGISKVDFYSGYQLGGINPPETPRIISPNNTTITTIRPIFDWTIVPNATSYILQIAASPDFHVMTGIYHTNAPPFEIPVDLSSSTDYFWKVLALNQAGISDYSSQGHFRTREIASPSGLPPDSAKFISDISIPDGIVVYPGQSFTKTWRMKNTGSSTWGSGYQLAFINGEQMGAPSAVDVPGSVTPGQEVDLSVNLIAPDIRGEHSGYWWLRNPQGTYFGDTLWVKINVTTNNAGSGNITLFDVAPASPSSATSVHLVGRARYFTDFRSMRFVVGTEVFEMPNFQQVGDQLVISADWNTTNLPRGDYAIVFEVAKNGDPDWAYAERQVKTYTLSGTPNSINLAPDRPLLKSPYDWYLMDASGSAASVKLCVHPSSDPDGNTVQYWFEIKDQGGGVVATSGWTINTCWTNTYAPNIYSWRVKAGDGSAESDWSQDTWNFTVAKGGVYIGSYQIFNPNTNDTHLCVFVTYDGIQGPEVYAWLNKAPDGSENGEWRLLDHYGPNAPPDCTQSNYHGFWIRSPEYETGVHKLRISAVKRDSGANAKIDTTYNVSYIRPSDVKLLAPSTHSNNGTWWNDRTIHFEWSASLRAEWYTLRVSMNSNPWADPSPLVEQMFSPYVTFFDYTFSQDYPKLYWSVRAGNSAGTTDSGPGVWFGIDTERPTCEVQNLPSSTYENVFQVNWGGEDDSSGVRGYDIQYRDTDRSEWLDWLVNTPITKPYELFNGLPGHVYEFRCRSIDQAGNIGVYTAQPDTSIKIDPASRPQSAWWDTSYQYKRNLIVQNNMTTLQLPAGYPVHLHFDSSTTPTAAEIYSASLSDPKCNDLRIVISDITEVDRIVDQCQENEIDIWFRTRTNVEASGVDSQSYSLYYGNSNALNPPNSRNKVFYPEIDPNHLRVFDMREGSGSILYDAVGNGNATMSSELSWTTTGKFGPAVLSPGDIDPEPRPGIDAGIGPQPMCSMSIEIWVKRLKGHSYSGILAHQEGGWSNPGRWVFMISNQKLNFTVYDVGSALSNRNIDESTFFDSYHHFAATYDCAGVIRLYIDGELDNTVYLDKGGMNSAIVPLKLLSTPYQTVRLAGEVSGFAISNIVRTDFSYGQFAKITSEPAVLAGAALTPPTSGSADLVLLDLKALTEANGSILFHALVKNVGTKETLNGFYTDLYVDHLPTGAGDYSGSLHFWVNDPIVAGEPVTFTTVINELPGMSLQSMTVGSEISSTLYAQVDSAGSVPESNEGNNIYADGVEVCFASADAYEDDDSVTAASWIGAGQVQTHNFDSIGDQDWLKFSAEAGEVYTISTSNLDILSDTYLYLYGTDGITLLASNDDYGGTLASLIEWTAPAAGTYRLLIKNWNPNASGCGTSYIISLTLASSPITPTPTSTTPPLGRTPTPTIDLRYKRYLPSVSK